jgi:predicted ATPase/class 3 adenylate cyclase
MSRDFSLYLAEDRVRALASGVDLPSHSTGCALLADIVGSSTLARQLTASLGQRPGVEALAQRINAAYDVLDEAVRRGDGALVSFAGDAALCWFDDGRSGSRAATSRAFEAALSVRRALLVHPDISVRIVLASGPIRRFTVGDPRVQLFDVLGGAAVERLALGEQLAGRGEILVDDAAAAALAPAVSFAPKNGAGVPRFAVAMVHRPAATPAAPPPPRPRGLRPPGTDVLRPWLLPAVFERLSAGHGAFLAELRPVVALFARLPDIDYESDEAAQHKLDRSVRHLQACVDRAGGALLQLTLGEKGGYAYACFGAPRAHEDDALRAVRVAIELLAGDAGDGAQLLRPLRIGLSGGVARTGAYGARARAAYGALGESVNLAAQLMELAEAGQVLVDDTVRHAVDADCTLRTLAPVVPRGQLAPVAVHEVLAVRRERATRAQRAVAGVAMVGREAELAQAEATLRGVADAGAPAQSAVIGISGEAGIGKSRLLAEVLARAQRMGFSVASGFCDLDLQPGPYLAWRAVWQKLLGVDDTRDGAPPHPALRRRLAGLVPDRASALGLLWPLLGLTPDTTDDADLPPAPQDRAALLTALLEDLLAARAAEQPVLIALEDIHWIDAESLQLLQRLALASAAQRVAFVLTWRPSGQDDAAAARVQQLPALTRIALHALAPQDVERLVAQRLAGWSSAGSAALVQALASKLNEQAEGNPFYIGELLEHLGERYRALHQWEADVLDVPPRLHAVVLSRIDSLDESQRAVLKAASVIGRRFRVDWLQGCHPALGTLERVKATLAELARKDFTLHDPSQPELVYDFKHAITRDVAYESMLHATRRELHARLGDYLEALDVQVHVDLLAHHYVLGNNVAKQRQYLRLAARTAQAAYANETALGHWGRLLPLLDDPTERAYVEQQRGTLFMLLLRHDDAEQCLARAMALAEAAGSQQLQARAARAQSQQFKRRGNSTSALSWNNRELELWRALGAKAEEAQGWLARARVLIGTRRLEEAGASAQRSEQMAAQCSDEPTLVGAKAERGYVLFNLSQPQAGAQLLAEALQHADRLGDKPLQLTVLDRLVGTTLAACEFDRCRAVIAQRLALARELGDRHRSVDCLRALGHLESKLGHAEQARECLESAAAMARRTDSKSLLGVTLLNLGHAAARRRDFAAARASQREAAELFAMLGDHVHMAVALNGLGWGLFLTGDIEESHHALQRAWSALQGKEFPAVYAQVLENLGHVSMARGAFDAAARYLRESVALTEGLQQPETTRSVLGTVAALCSRQGQARRAITLVAAARTCSKRAGLGDDPGQAEVEDKALELARTQLSRDEVDAAWAEGSALSDDQALALARLAGLPETRAR